MRRIGFPEAMAAASALLLLLAAGATPAQAVAGVTVTPSTDLTGPTPASIEATGLTPNAWHFVGECNEALTACEMWGAASDSAGSIRLRVLLEVVVGGPDAVAQADCRVVVCRVVVGTVDTGPVVVAESGPITFAPNASVSAPPMAVTPSTGLTDGQSVEIFVPPGTFPPGLEVNVVQCLTNGPGPFSCGQAATVLHADPETGAVRSSFIVHRQLDYLPLGWVSVGPMLVADCSVSACELDVVGLADYALIASSAGITFVAQPITSSTTTTSITTSQTTVGSTTSAGSVAVAPRFTG